MSARKAIARIGRAWFPVSGSVPPGVVAIVLVVTGTTTADVVEGAATVVEGAATVVVGSAMDDGVEVVGDGVEVVGDGWDVVVAGAADTVIVTVAPAVANVPTSLPTPSLTV